MSGPESSESRRLTALTELWRSAVKPPTVLELERGLDALRGGLESGRKRPRRTPRVTLLAAAVLACVVLGAVVLVPRFRARSVGPREPVAVVRVEGGTIFEGGYLSEVGAAGVRLYFNEGSKFALAPGARGRLGALTAEGARLVLDQGTASFQITPNLERRWLVEAGPFAVSVRGTDFTVVWDPTREELEVKLRRGRVAVSGPVVGEELVLRPGQSLRVSLPEGQSVIAEGRAEQAAEEPRGLGTTAVPSAAAPLVLAPSAAPPTAMTAAAASAGAGSERRWREALANGQWDRILADVERDGVEASLRVLSSDELFALADAARYRRRPELARAALLAQRERFPSSPRAADATFLLGRVEESRADAVSAIRRYEEYLVRAPAGTYAAEALGRKMILVKQTQGPASARQVAAEYLRRFPSGSYAEAARTLERAP